MGVSAIVNNIIPGANGILKGIFAGGVYGGISGGLAAGIDASSSGGNFGDAFWAGFKSGAITGGAMGGVKGYFEAKKRGLNGWTGAPNRNDYLEEASYTQSGEVRPDDDGYITLSEANDHWRNGGGKPLFVDVSKISLGQISAELFPNGPGSEITYNILAASGNLNDALVHGKVNMTLYSSESLGVTSYHVMIAPEYYDFDFKKWNSFGNIVRNIENGVGRMYARKGTPFMMRYYGRQYIPYEIGFWNNQWVK